MIGDPLFLIAFKAADDLDIYLVNDSLIAQGWRMIALQHAAGAALLHHPSQRAPGLAEAYLEALHDGRRRTRRTTRARRRCRAPCTASAARRSARRWSSSPWSASSTPCTTCRTSRVTPDGGALDPRRRPRQRRAQGRRRLARGRGAAGRLPSRARPHRPRRRRHPGRGRVVDRAAVGRARGDLRGGRRRWPPARRRHHRPVRIVGAGGRGRRAGGGGPALGRHARP